MRNALWLAALAVSSVVAQVPKAPVADNPVVEITGTVVRIDALRPGSGMPSFEIEQRAGSRTLVRLGSIRYLMQENFNPKAGSELRVKGYKLPDEIVAIEIYIPSEKRTVRLRDENGWPLWGGMRGRHCCRHGER